VASESPNTIKRSTARKRKQIALIIPHKLYIIRRLESGVHLRKVMAAYNTGSSNIYDTYKGRNNYDQ
jgi:hypothetical protein